MTRKLNILFVHQNFPAQFKCLSVALAQDGHQVVALGQKRTAVDGVTVIPYQYLSNPTKDIHPLAREHEAKLIRAEAVASVCEDLKSKGFLADVIYVHPGWGEALFLRDVFPGAKIIVYCEYYYNMEGQDVNFDPEFAPMTIEQQCNLRMKNTCSLHAFDIGDAFVSPTRWQRKTYPKFMQRKIRVIHDGLDFDKVKPDAGAVFEIPEIGLRLTTRDQVITYAARNLEPLRGIHTFLRALPDVLRELPRARVIIFGRDASGYGPPHPSGDSWRSVILNGIADKSNFDRVHFLGWADYDTYLSALQISSTHVYLTYPFLVSWSMLEAMMVGMPLVVSDTGPVAEFVPKRFRVPFFDTDQLSNAICSSVMASRQSPGAAIKSHNCSSIRRLELVNCLNDHRSLLADQF